MPRRTAVAVGRSPAPLSRRVLSRASRPGAIVERPARGQLPDLCLPASPPWLMCDGVADPLRHAGRRPPYSLAERGVAKASAATSC